MTELPLPAAILDDLISAFPTDVTGSGNDVIQDGGRQRELHHLPSSPHQGSENFSYTAYM